MLIGVDIDEVLCETLDFGLIFFEGKIWNLPITREQVTDYFLPNIPGYESISREVAVAFFVDSLKSSRALNELHPVSWAYEVLKKRKEEGHTFHAITARGEPMRPSTEAWMEKNFPNLFDTITFCNHYRDEYPKYTKEEICKQEGIKIFIEDNPKYAIDLEKLGIKVFLLDKPWNKDLIENEHPWIIKVKNRSEISL